MVLAVGLGAASGLGLTVAWDSISQALPGQGHVPFLPAAMPPTPKVVFESGGEEISLYEYDFSKVPVIGHQPQDEWDLGPASTVLDDATRQTYCDLLWCFRNGQRRFILQDASDEAVYAAWRAVNYDHIATLFWLDDTTAYTFEDGFTINGEYEERKARETVEGEPEADGDGATDAAGSEEPADVEMGDIVDDGTDMPVEDGTGDIPLDLGGDGRVFVCFDVGMTDEEISSTEAALEAAHAEYAAGLWEGASEYDKATHAFEYVIGACDYVLEGDTPEQRQEDSKGKQSAASALVARQSVCGGYANAMTYLLRREGIRCWTAYGRNTEGNLPDGYEGEGEDIAGDEAETDGGHAWNVALLDGAWCYIDATFGDLGNTGELEGEGAVTMADFRACDWSYFGMTTAQAEENGYVLDDPDQYPMCDSWQNNWYQRNGLWFEWFDSGALDSLVDGARGRGERLLTVQYASQEAFDAARGWIESGYAGPEYAGTMYGTNDRMRLVMFVWVL